MNPWLEAAFADDDRQPKPSPASTPPPHPPTAPPSPWPCTPNRYPQTKRPSHDHLRYDVLVHDGMPRQREQRLPDGSPIVSSPVSTTLIYGEQAAALVEPPFTHDRYASGEEAHEEVGHG